MKYLGMLSFIVFYLSLSTVQAQEVTYDRIFGNWEYQSPKGKSKLSYDFTLEKKFVCIAEHKQTETKTEGDFSLDKKGENDRLILNTSVEGLKTKTHINYYFIRFSGPDTIKLQMVSDNQEEWRGENRKNTMTFIRKKEKPKKAD